MDLMVVWKLLRATFTKWIEKHAPRLRTSCSFGRTIDLSLGQLLVTPGSSLPIL